MHAEVLGNEFSRYITMLKMESYNPEIQLRNKDSIEFQLKKLLEVGDGDFVNTIYIDKNLIQKETPIKSLTPRLKKAMTGLEKTSTSVCRPLVDSKKCLLLSLRFLF